VYANAKMIPVEIIPEVGGEGIRKSSAVGEFKGDTFDAL
jgi:hypothetical protein